MAKVTLHRNGQEYIIEDLTFDELKELIGANGHDHHNPAREGIMPRPITARAPDFEGFVGSLSPRGRDFIFTLKHHPQGIEANSLAGKLGYTDAKQIGGLTGGGLAKTAKRTGVKLKDVYRSEVTFQNSRRTVTFYPERHILAMLQREETPA